ncbi:MAG: IS607 family transposase [Bacteroidetes bacterium]|nr:MAG: IS607 family transposase [Bacteroidota bacterium]
MKSKEVLRILGVTRVTLMFLVKKGKIRATRLANTHYEYLDEDVYAYAGINRKQYQVIYARVSTTKQKKDLENQIGMLENFCASRGFVIDKVFKDIASGLSFEKRTSFFELLDLILDNKVSKVFITYKDRLSRVGFGLFKHLFSKYGTEIIILNEAGNEKLDNEEIFEEIISLLPCFSMKHYSNRQVKQLKNILTKDESIEDENKEFE